MLLLFHPGDVALPTKYKFGKDTLYGVTEIVLVKVVLVKTSPLSFVFFALILKSTFPATPGVRPIPNATAFKSACVTDNVDLRIKAKNTNESGDVLTRTTLTRTISVTPYNVSFPNLYFVGAATTYTSMGIIGSATPNGWGGDTNLTQDANNPHLWYALGVTLTTGNEFLFRGNGDWGLAWKYNGSQHLYGTSILNSGSNFPFNAPSGNYDVWFNDLDGGYILLPQ